MKKKDKNKVELVGFIVRVNGEDIILKREECSFYTWSDGDGEYNGCDLNFCIGKKLYTIVLE